MTAIREKLRHERGALKAKLYTLRTQLCAVPSKNMAKHREAWLLYRSLESIPVWQGQRESIMTYILPLTEHKATIQYRVAYTT